ncbi:MAG TPA: type II toxin-antitoxin system VapC family toxin [Castellaniella sp.]|uniref:type II toxin-antitoxin system VapC family toxin n=1 Tax=Castellaniella sp. TaxID=1955812 RepID=UPI002F142DF6
MVVAMHVLDSNTISYYFRGERPVVEQMQKLAPSVLAVPAVVEYELRYGLLRLPPEAAAPRLVALATFLAPLTILAFDGACAAHAARIRATLESSGTPIGPHDTLIAATALQHQAVLVTRNVREFSRVPGLQWENWFQDDRG